MNPVIEQVPNGTIDELSRTLGKMEEHLKSIDEKLKVVQANELRIRSLEQSRARDRGVKTGIALILGWLGYDTFQVGSWFQ